MATDTLLSPMMCLALWATKHYTQGKILDDCPLVEVVNCKDCKHNYEDTCDIDEVDYFCANAERKE